MRALAGALARPLCTAYELCSRFGSHAERFSQRGLFGDRYELLTMTAESAVIVAPKAGISKPKQQRHSGRFQRFWVGGGNRLHTTGGLSNTIRLRTRRFETGNILERQ